MIASSMLKLVRALEEAAVPIDKVAKARVVTFEKLPNITSSSSLALPVLVGTAAGYLSYRSLQNMTEPGAGILEVGRFSASGDLIISSHLQSDVLDAGVADSTGDPCAGVSKSALLDERFGFIDKALELIASALKQPDFEEVLYQIMAELCLKQNRLPISIRDLAKATNAKYPLVLRGVEALEGAELIESEFSNTKQELVVDLTDKGREYCKGSRGRERDRDKNTLIDLIPDLAPQGAALLFGLLDFLRSSEKVTDKKSLKDN